MSKKRFYKFRIRHVEYFDSTFLVEGDSAADARRRLEEDFDLAGYSYEKTTDCTEDCRTTFALKGVASPDDHHRFCCLEADD